MLIAIAICYQQPLSAQTFMEITLVVNDSQIGVTTRSIGAVEGNVNFDLASLVDLGINTYRIYGGIPRWEARDDDKLYGYPGIAQIKANPNLINWAWWDQAMTTPPGGSDYWWTTPAGQGWQGSAYSLFQQLQQAHIRPVVSIRPVDTTGTPDWAQRLNPPHTEADWNEWWEHVFALVYWLNVRHDLRVDDFEIHNEPDQREQGWAGTQADYFQLAQVASDAIRHVYSTYLPDRPYHIHAPTTIGGSHWPLDSLDAVPQAFTAMNIHTYDADLSGYVSRVRQGMNDRGFAAMPIWVGEWGSYQGGYETMSLALKLLKNLIRTSQPGDSYVEGSHLFSLYDWQLDWGTIQGLINREGDRQLSYYALRMGIRALQGGKEVLPIVPTPESVMAMATRDDRNVNVLLVNDRPSDAEIDIDLSAVQQSGEVKLWQLRADVMDQPIPPTLLDRGSIHLRLPMHSAMMAQVPIMARN